VDVTGVRFIGVVRTSLIPDGGGYGYQNSCGFGAYIQFRE